MLLCSMNMQDPRISAALSVMMGINLMGDDEKMETEPSAQPPAASRPNREPTPPPEKTEDEDFTEEQKQVLSYLIGIKLVLKA